VAGAPDGRLTGPSASGSHTLRHRDAQAAGMDGRKRHRTRGRTVLPAMTGSRDVPGTVMRGSAVRIAGHVVGVALSVVSAALLLRHLGPADAGSYLAVLALALLAAGVADAGLGAIALRELSTRTGTSRAEAQRTLIGLRTLLATAGAVTAIAYALVAGFDGALLAGAVIAGAAIVAQVIQATLTTTLLVELRVGWATAAEVVRQVVTTATVVALVRADASLTAFFLAPLLGSGAALALTAVVVGLRAARPSLDLALVRRLLRDAAPYAAAVVASALCLRTGILVLEHRGDARETSYFGASLRVVEALVVLPALAVSTAFPLLARAAHDTPERLVPALQRGLDLTFVLGIWLALEFAVGAPFVLAVVGGDAFAPAADVLRLHVLAVAAAGVSAVLGYGLLALRSHRSILTVTLVALSVHGGATIALAGAHGARGAAVGSVLGELLLVVGYAGALARASAAPILRPRHLTRLLLAATAAAAPAAVLPAAAAMAVAAVVFPAIVLSCGAAPPDLRGLLDVRRAPA